MVAAGIVEEHPMLVRLEDPEAAWQARRSGEGDHVAAGQLIEDNNRRLDAVFDEVDILCTPTTPGPPHPHAGPGDRVNTALTWAFNLSGHPAISLPAGFDSLGRPVGLQLVTRRGDDRLMVAVAAQYQNATGITPLPPLAC
jgi:Asp-tRNA(Asn)/Glu-tRNA(Gln) amidotransferase A subunit family amidase